MKTDKFIDIAAEAKSHLEAAVWRLEADDFAHALRGQHVGALCAAALSMAMTSVSLLALAIEYCEGENYTD